MKSINEYVAESNNLKNPTLDAAKNAASKITKKFVVDLIFESDKFNKDLNIPYHIGESDIKSIEEIISKQLTELFK